LARQYGRRYLFDLESDQHEHVNLFDEHSEVTNKLHADLQTWTQQLRPPGLPDGKKMRERGWYEFDFDGSR